MVLFVFDDQPVAPKKTIRRTSVGKAAAPKPQRLRGCETCPLGKGRAYGQSNGVHCVSHAVVGKVAGRSVLILAQAPGKVETLQGVPLVGPAGSLFWRRAEKVVGLKRDLCDVDNTVRCRPTKLSGLGNTVDRAPEPDEVYHCSIHTETQLVRAKPKVILLLGKVAQKQYLGRLYKSDVSIYHDERFNCKVVCSPHPSYLLRGAPKEGWEDFDSALHQVADEVLPGRKTSTKPYWEEQDYQRLENPGEVASFFSELDEERLSVSVDLEDGYDEQGRHVILCTAFCSHVGKARVIFYDHPEVLKERAASGTSRNTELLKNLTARFLSGPRKKIFWYGVSDVTKFELLWGVKTQGYESDAMLTEHQAYPDRGDYRLERVAEVRFKKFAGYKHIIDKYVGSPPNYARIPIPVILLRCCGDADLTLRAYLTTYHRASKPLVKMLVGTSFFLQEMESHGGGFYDYEYARRLSEIYTPLRAQAVSRIAVVAGDPDFNPTDDALAWLLKEKLGLKMTVLTTKEKRVAVGQAILESMLGKHPVIRDVLEKKFLDKVDSTYIVGFGRSANFHHGVVMTIWKITGTGTGRLASGGGGNKKQEDRDRVNLQNIHGDKHAQNLLVSTLRWRDIAKLPVTAYASGA